MIERELRRITKVSIEEKRGVRRVQENDLKSKGLLQVYGSAGRLNQKVSVDFAKVMYEYVYMFLFSSWNFNLSL